MNRYRVDLHLHTCLSPCGSLEMSPSVIVGTALERGLSAIAVTDHNSTLQCAEIQSLGADAGLTVFAGVEVTTREEAHCVVLFPSEKERICFQEYLDEYLPHIPNDPERFGDQVWVNRHDEILGEVPCLLLSAIDRSVNQIAAFARQMGCLFIPAHVERPSYSLIGQLGFLDPSLPVDAVEYNNEALYKQLLFHHPYLRKYVQYTASDAHYPEQIGTNPSILRASELSFESIVRACNHEEEYLLISESEYNRLSGVE